MKQFLMSFMLFFALSASAQRVDKPGEPYYVYCAIDVSMDAIIIIGEDKEPYFILDEDGEKVKFEKKVNARTYMSKRGWEYVEALTYDVVFRKLVISDKDAFKDFKLMYKLGKNKGKIKDDFQSKQ